MNRRQTLFALAAVGFAASAKPADGKGGPLIVVHKSETCGCCKLWVAHLEKAGFTTRVNDESNLAAVKERVGVPYGMGSCHTGEVGGYFIEGHVPAADIQRLLREKLDARGLAVPGMPAGSPGMEIPSGAKAAYDVFLVARDGKTSVFAHHPGT